MNYNFIDKPKVKVPRLNRIIYILVGLLLLTIDIGIVYVLYTSAAWLASLIAAPAVITLLLMLIGAFFFGGIILILLVFGVIGVFVGVVG